MKKGCREGVFERANPHLGICVMDPDYFRGSSVDVFPQQNAL